MTEMTPEALKQIVAGKKRILVVTHDYPDPDCIASAWGLKRLLGDRFGIDSTIAFGGFIGRAENKAMVELLRIEMISAHEIDRSHYDGIIMVDTQPGTGNNSLEADAEVDLVIDHHPLKIDGASVPACPPTGMSAPPKHSFIRKDFGATTTIVADLLFRSGMEPDPHLAAALYLGIKTDTMALGREASKADREHYVKLFAMADHEILWRIERPDLGGPYFRGLLQAIEHASLYEEALVCHLADVAVPESIAEVAEFLLRRQGVEWVLCVGTFRKEVYFSIRMRRASGDAGEVARAIAGARGRAGGHEFMAGGRIAAEDLSPDELHAELQQRFLDELGIDRTTWKPIC